MTVRRVFLLALVFYVSADYCDASIPGVFSFDAETFFVDSVDARSPARVALPINKTFEWRARDSVVPLRAVAPTPAHHVWRAPRRAGPPPYVARARLVSAPSISPEDH